MSNKFLLDESPLVILPSLAVAVGLNNAIILQQTHYWLMKSNHIHNGKKWFYKTYKDWKTELPWWSDRTIRRTISDLEKLNLIETANFNQMRADQTKWYSINYTVLNKLVTKAGGQSDQLGWSECPQPPVNVTKPIPEITTDIENDDNDENPGKEVEVENPPLNLREKTIQQIEQLYLQRKGNGLFVSAKDINAIVDVVDEGVDLKDALNWINEAFDNYKPRHSRDRINSFNYIAQHILTRHYEKIERQKAIAGGGNSGGIGRNSSGAVPEIPQSKKENGGTAKQQKQRLVGENGEVQDTECDY